MAHEFEIFEGQCPFCKESGCLELVFLSGTKPFVEEHKTENIGTRFTIWSDTPLHWLSESNYLDPEEAIELRREELARRNAIGGVGALTYTCTRCGKEVYIEKDPHGDWHSNA